MSRIATISQNRFAVFATLNTQKRLFEAQTQIGTGLKSQTFAGLGRDAGRLVSLRNEFERLDRFVTNIETTERRLELTGFTLERVEDVAREFRTTLLSAKNGDQANVIALPALAQGLLNQIVDLLNVRDESRFLFSGANIRSRAVDLNNGTYTPPTVPPFPGTANLDYYGGDNVVQQARIDEGFVISYGIRANESAIEKIIRSFDSISEISFTSPASAAEVTAVDAAITLLTEALDANTGGQKTIGALFANVELNRTLLNDIKTKQENFKAFAERQIVDIQQVNTIEAITRLNAEQVTLEASFATIARIQSLSLTNFLR